MVATASLRLSSREYSNFVIACVSSAIIKMSRNIQISYSTGGRREEEEREKRSILIVNEKYAFVWNLANP